VEQASCSQDQHLLELLLELNHAEKYVPNLEDIDKTEGKGTGTANVVRWFYGKRLFYGSPNKYWPDPNQLLKCYPTAADWVKLLKGSINEKKSIAGRFKTLMAISVFVIASCPPQYKNKPIQSSRSVDPDFIFRAVLRFATELDCSRSAHGSVSLSMWWDRVRVNQSSRTGAGLALIQINAMQARRACTDDEAEEIRKLIAAVIADSNSGITGIDSFGESHIGLNKRQQYKAAIGFKRISGMIKQLGGRTSRKTGANLDLTAVMKAKKNLNSANVADARAETQKRTGQLAKISLIPASTANAVTPTEDAENSDAVHPETRDLIQTPAPILTVRCESVPADGKALPSHHYFHLRERK
jgi:hypothetical protein